MEGDRPARPPGGEEHEQPERRQSLLLAVEAGLSMAGSGGAGLAKIDRAVNACVMLAAAAGEFDDAVGVITFRRSLEAALGRGFARPGQMRRVVETLAALEAGVEEPDWAGALASLARVAGTRSLIVIFSDLHYVEADPLLAVRLGTLARRHRVVFASVIDQTLIEQAAVPVVDEDTLYRRGTAAAMLQRRRLAAALLEQRGVYALDVAPGGLTTAVVSRFRQIRREDRL